MLPTRPCTATNVQLAEHVPTATYRLQFNRQFTLPQARSIIPYLDDLGVSHIYSSPLLKAVPGSAHGYDVCDYTQLNPELGTLDDLQQLHVELASHRMGLVLDVVPNHMGIAGQNNRWWCDVLARGQRSKYARYFDIDWEAPDPRLGARVAMPILGERYHQAMRRGIIRLVEEGETLWLRCGDQNLPLSPESVSMLRRSGKPVADINSNLEALDQIVQSQHYLLTHRRNGPSVLNYRRFFTITSLAGISIEKETVFAEVFALVKQWLDNGWLDGLRVDHIDGLRHPEKFLQRLRKLAPKAWIVVEKILEPREMLRPDWPVEGSTGYDFLNAVNSVFIDNEAEKPLTDFYRQFTGDNSRYSEVVRAKRRMIILEQLTPETRRLTGLLFRISARHWVCRDFTRRELREALMELAVCMPVYRTYVDPGESLEISKRDTRLIRSAAAAARVNRGDLPGELFDFLEGLLSLRYRGPLEDDFVLRFQQLTGPLTAKAVEDTACFCYPRFAALNEVGGDPGRFGLALPAFHRFCQRQENCWPASMAASATHDTKWGGDVRARLAVLSERPAEWTQAVLRWSRMNETKRCGNMPDHKSEYLFYQALVGAWPIGPERLLPYVQKAAREAKEHTSWDNPVPAYEEALQDFVRQSLADPVFTSDVEAFVTPLLDPGRINSLSQTLVKLTATGVPDIYQGAELWDLNLTDPDNRRPVDYTLRMRMLADAKNLGPDEVWQRRESGLPKMWLIRKTLAVRRRCPGIFTSEPYEPLAVSGARAKHLLAFSRGKAAVTVVQRLSSAINTEWADTAVCLPSGHWINVLTDSPVTCGLMKDLTARFPVAFLLREDL